MGAIVVSGGDPERKCGSSTDIWKWQIGYFAAH